MIVLDNVTKRFGSTVAVDHLSLTVSRSQIYGFLGPNGAGKSTTIRMLAGLLQPDSGNILLNQILLSEKPVDVKQLLGYIPDQPFLYERLTGREFLGFVARIYRLEPAAAARQINYYLKLFQLEAVADCLLQEYSHGMRQKIVMSSAFIHEPLIYLIDEPMVGLDPKSARIVKQILREQCQAGATVFLSTHTLDIAEELCDRIGIIHHGTLIASGTLDQLRHMAAAESSKLNDIFLRLTEDDQDQSYPLTASSDE